MPSMTRIVLETTGLLIQRLCVILSNILGLVPSSLTGIMQTRKSHSRAIQKRCSTEEVC